MAATSPSEVSGNVRVAVRVRPLIGREIVEKDSICISVPPSDVPCVLIGSGEEGKTFAFDYVFPPVAPQAAVYDTCVQPLLDSFIKGYNSTILAYGQTGSGKTFTVGTGNETLSSTDDQLGIIPRLARRMFDRIADARKAHPAAEFSIHITFLEIYGDEIRDLLNMGSAKVLSIRDGEHGINVTGATERSCESASDMLSALEEGSLCRTTGSTAMNTHSSRSHAIFTVILDQRIPYSAEEGPVAESATAAAASQTPADAMEHRISKFHILDLAGSERAKRTQATGRRLQEGININLGLLALGNVISALSDEEKRRRGAHVPYRDSKLTRLLQDSLGGNSQTCMIACVSPAEANFEESLNTLRYAARARNIKNKPVINRDANANQIAQLKAEIEALRAALQASGADRTGGMVAGSPSLVGAGVSISALLEATGARDLTQVIDRLSDMRSASDEVEALRSRCMMSEDEVARLTSELKKSRAAVEAAQEGRIEAEVKLALLEDQIRVGGSDGGAAVEAETVDAITRLTRRVHELEEQLRVAQEAARTAYHTASFHLGSPLSRTPSRRNTRGPLSPVAATAAELEAALHGVDPRLLIGGEDDDDDIEATKYSPVDVSPPASLADAEEALRYPGSAAFRRIMRRLDVAPGDVAAGSSEGDDAAVHHDEADAAFHDAQRDFETRQKAMSRHVEDLDGNITVKQRYVLALEEKAARLESMKRVYDTKLRDMEREMHAVIKEREQLMHELAQAEHMVEEERSKATSAIRAKLEEADRRVRTYQERLRNLENVSRMQARASAEIRRLQHDIAELRKARVAQIAMMRAEKQRFMEEVAERKRQALALQKEGAALKSELARVKADGEKREAVLRRKVEEATAAQRRLQTIAGPNGAAVMRGVGTACASPATPTTAAAASPGGTNAFGAAPEKGGADKHQTRARQVAVAAVARSVRECRRTTRGGTASTRTSGIMSAAVADLRDATDPAATALRQQLEEAVARIAEKERRVEELERRLRAREADVRMLEQLVEQRDALKSMMLPATPSGAGPQPAAAVAAQLIAADAEANGLDVTLLNDIDAFFHGHDEDEGIAATGKPQDTVTAPTDAARDRKLLRPASVAIRDMLVTPREAVAAGDLTGDAEIGDGRGARSFTEEETEALRELEEKIELAQTRLGYQDEKILHLAQADEELAREIARAAPSLGTTPPGTPGAPVAAAEGLQHFGAIADLPEAQLALKLLFGMVVDAKRDERKRASVVSELEMKVHDLQASLDASDASIKALRLEHERRLMDAKREQAAETDTLLRLAVSTFTGVPAGDFEPSHAAASPDLLSVASPSELMNMLRTTRERFTEMEQEIAAQSTTIKELQHERERLRSEINRLSTVALRKQEQQHRRSSREALRHGTPSTGHASAPLAVLTAGGVRSSSMKDRGTHDGLHVQGSAISGATREVVYGGPPHSAPSAAAAIAAANAVQGGGGARQATMNGAAVDTAVAALPAAASTSDSESPEQGDERKRSVTSDDAGDAGNKARAWWSERGIVPVSVAVPPTAPPPGHGMPPIVRVVVAPPSVPIKPLVRASSRTSNNMLPGGATGGAEPASTTIRPPSASATRSPSAHSLAGQPAETDPASVRATARAPATTNRSRIGPPPPTASVPPLPPAPLPRALGTPHAGTISDSVSATLALPASAGVPLATVTASTELNAAAADTRRDDALVRQSISAKYLAALQARQGPTSRGPVTEPMQVRTSIPDIMSPPNVPASTRPAGTDASADAGVADAQVE